MEGNRLSKRFFAAILHFAVEAIPGLIQKLLAKPRKRNRGKRL